MCIKKIKKNCSTLLTPPPPPPTLSISLMLAQTVDLHNGKVKYIQILLEHS